MADPTTRTSDENDKAWDDICVNPQQEALDTGHEEGRQAGLARGFRDGKALGILKGVEYGMEVGFLRGALEIVSQSLSFNNVDHQSAAAAKDSLQRERIEKTVAALSEMIDQFPSPDQIFQETQQYDIDNSRDNQDDSEDNLGMNKSTDLTSRMQAMRSKFKLLTVQMKWNNFALKTIMDTAKQAADASQSSAENFGDLESEVQETDW